MFIYYIARRAYPDGAVIDGLGQKTAYTLWHMREGSVHLTGPDGEQTIRQGDWAITTPGTVGHVARRARLQYMAFDVIPRRKRWVRRRSFYDRPWPEVDLGTGIQPEWPVICRVAPDVIVPARLVDSLAKVIDRIQDDYWLSEQHRNQANGHFQSWLAGLLIDCQDDAARRRARPNQRPDWANCAAHLVGRAAVLGHTVAEIAAMLGMTRSAFSERFRRACGESPGAVMDRARMGAAMRAMEKGRKSIAYIAANCGYSDASAFGRRFRQLHGVTPGQWRREHRLR